MKAPKLQHTLACDDPFENCTCGFKHRQEIMHMKTEGDYYRERTEHIAKLERSLWSLWHRHNDGSDERFWAEWDDVKELLNG